MEIPRTAFLGCMMASLVIPAVANTTQPAACSATIDGCGLNVTLRSKTDCCVCRAQTSEECTLTAEQFCLVELLGNNNEPNCCPCTGGGWSGCMSPQNKKRLIKLFKIHDKLVNILNFVGIDDTVVETIIRRVLAIVVNRLHDVLDDMREECDDD